MANETIHFKQFGEQLGRSLIAGKDAMIAALEGIGITYDGNPPIEEVWQAFTENALAVSSDAGLAAQLAALAGRAKALEDSMKELEDLPGRTAALEKLSDELKEVIAQATEIIAAINGGGDWSGSFPGGALPAGVAMRSILTLDSDFTHERTEEDGVRIRPGRSTNQRVWAYVDNHSSIGRQRDDMFYINGYPEDVTHFGPLEASAAGFTFNITSQINALEDEDNPEMIIVTYDVLDDSDIKVAVLRMEVVPGFVGWSGEWRRNTGIGYRLYLEEVHGTFYIDSFTLSLSWEAFEVDCTETAWVLDFAKPVGKADEFALVGEFAVGFTDLLSEELLETLIHNTDFTGDENITGTVEMKFSRFSEVVRLNCYFDEDRLHQLFGPEISMIPWAMGNVGVGIPIVWDGDKAAIIIHHMQLLELVYMLNSSFSPSDIRDFILAAFLKYTTPKNIIKTGGATA